MAELYTDIRIRSIEPHYPFVSARVPLKFGAVVVEALDFCHVRAEVENRRGEVGEGWGAMFLMDMWAWPSKTVDHETRMKVMRETNKRLCTLFESHNDFGHPIEIFHRLEGDLQKVAEEVCREMRTAESLPFLGTLVCASPIDAAIHDAFGNANGIDTYDGYGKDFMAGDLSTWLGDDFKGDYVGDFLSPMPAMLPAFHLVGGLDKLRESELTGDDPDDGLPVSLDQWIRFDKLRCLKVKLKGTDQDWDLDRFREVAAIAREEQRKQGYSELYLTADTNEQCESPDYCIELLERIREDDKETFEKILYLEQPTGRDLEKYQFDMRKLAKIKPVIIDESLTTMADFDRALEQGWSGIALKACKCQSASLVFACRAERLGIAYTVQDLTNPGIALIQSVGLAGHLRTLKGVEANSRQFFPWASKAEARVHPGVFKLRDGCIETTSIRGNGLGYRWEEIDR
jgi:L-alanine-DL-glutamate epimerase-like enolase superfamily enzyme